MTEPRDTPVRATRRGRNDPATAAITIAILALASYGIIQLMPAQHFGELVWKLTAAGVLGMLVAFGVSASFTSGSSADLGAAVFGLLLELVVIALALGLAGYWPHSVAVVHERAQWGLFGVQALFLLFVTLA